MLTVWCILDVCMLVAGIHYAIIEGRVLRRRSHHATYLAKFVCAIYSLLFGVPIGTTTKMLVVFWLRGRVSFSLPFTLISCCIGATGLAMLIGARVVFVR